MKNHLLFPVLLLFGLASGQTQSTLCFSYDAGGNQISRAICMPTQYLKESNEPVKTAETITKDDLIKDDLYKNISYYPNPVLEELYVQWENVDNNYVDNIQLYSINGQLMKSYSNIRGTDLATITFSNYPQGIYHLILIYSNGEQKTLKIVKQ